MTSKSTLPNRLNIPGFRDDAVEYCNWQKSQNKRPELKLEYQKAYDVIIRKGSDLELIRRNPNPKFLIDTMHVIAPTIAKSDQDMDKPRMDSLNHLG